MGNSTGLGDQSRKTRGYPRIYKAGWGIKLGAVVSKLKEEWREDFVWPMKERERERITCNGLIYIIIL